MTESNSIRSELAELKRELHARIRGQVSTMTATERALYVASLPKAEALAFKRIIHSTDAVSPERAREREDMDRRMGLVKQKIGCRREGSTLYLGVPVNEKPAPQPSAAAAPPRGTRKPAAPQRPTPRASTRTEYERELDRRMGLASPRAGCTRNGNTLILGS